MCKRILPRLLDSMSSEFNRNGGRKLLIREGAENLISQDDLLLKARQRSKLWNHQGTPGLDRAGRCALLVLQNRL